MLRISELTDVAQMASLKSEWQELVASNPDATLFQTWEWQSLWWEHFGHGRLWILAVREGERLVGLAPLFRAPYHGLPLRRLSFLGTGISDYLDVITLPEYAPACREAFLGHLARRRGWWDLADLQQLPEGSLLTWSPAPEEVRARLILQDVCPYLRLPSDWDSFAATIGKKLRSNIGYYRRLLEREFRLECEVVADGELPAAMEELFRLHQHRWRRRGLPGAFARERARKFHRAVARAFLERGWLRLHRLRLNGETRAVLYCFRYGDRGYYYLGGFDPELSRYSLGTVLTAEAIRDAILGGAREFDFLRGDEPYKYAWRPHHRRNLRLLLWKRSFPSCLAPALNSAERRVEREAKRLARQL